MADLAINEKCDCWGGIAVLKARRRLLVILCEFGCLTKDFLCETRSFLSQNQYLPTSGVRHCTLIMCTGNGAMS